MTFIITVMVTILIMMSILTLIPLTVSAHFGDALDAKYGITPIIDGTISEGEWADADFTLCFVTPALHPDVTANYICIL